MKKLLPFVLLLAGCASYQSKIDVGQMSFALPKDAVFSYLQISIPVQAAFTNDPTPGVISLVISNGSFKMNPAVIDAKTAQDVQIINALKDAFQAGMLAARP